MNLKFFVSLKEAFLEGFKPSNILYTFYDATIGLIKMIILFYTYKNNHALACFMFMSFYLCGKSFERRKSKQTEQIQQEVVDYLNVCESVIKEYEKQLNVERRCL